MSLARQNFSTASEDALNAQINVELKASHVYLQMHAYFLRDNVSLHGFAKYFKKQSDEEREHGEKLIQYLTDRGGKVVLQGIEAPALDFNSAMTALELNLQLEREVNKSLLHLTKLAEDENDNALAEFIEAEYLREQVQDIKRVSDMVTNLRRVGGDGVGLWLFDKELAEKY